MVFGDLLGGCRSYWGFRVALRWSFWIVLGGFGSFHVLVTTESCPNSQSFGISTFKKQAESRNLQNVNSGGSVWKFLGF